MRQQQGRGHSVVRYRFRARQSACRDPLRRRPCGLNQSGPASGCRGCRETARGRLCVRRHTRSGLPTPPATPPDATSPSRSSNLRCLRTPAGVISSRVARLDVDRGPSVFSMCSNCCRVSFIRALGGMAKKHATLNYYIGILIGCKQHASAGIAGTADGPLVVPKRSFQLGFARFSVLRNLLRSFCDNPLDSKAARLL